MYPQIKIMYIILKKLKADSSPGSRNFVTSKFGGYSSLALSISKMSLRRVHTKQNLHSKSFINRAQILGIVFKWWRIHVTFFSVIAAPWMAQSGCAPASWRYYFESLFITFGGSGNKSLHSRWTSCLLVILESTSECACVPSFNTHIFTLGPLSVDKGKPWINYFRGAATIINRRCFMDQSVLHPGVTFGSQMDIATTAAI